MNSLWTSSPHSNVISIPRILIEQKLYTILECLWEQDTHFAGGNGQKLCESRLKPWIHYAIFAMIVQSEQVDASWGKSEPVCRLQLTDSTENLVVYYGHWLWFFSFSLWFYPVGGYQTCLIVSADFRTLIVFICHASPSNKEHVSAWVRCDGNNFKVW